jgi:hypothetical protein
MANPTTNYGFVLPTATDLVTDLPADFDVALQGVDTRLKALQPGTTLGDLAYSSATANTNTRLGIGSTGNVLTVTGGVPVWAAPAGGGKVLQVIYGSSTTDTTVSTGTFTDTTLSASITPSAATSKVLVLVSLVSGGANSGTVFQTNVRLVRASTSVWEPAYSSYPSMNNGGASSVEFNGPIPINYLDSPATTSATTYKMQGRREQAAGSARFQFGGSISTMILLEIGA